MAELKYKRVLLKLSGEALAGEKQIGIDPHTVSKICAEIADVVDMGLEVALVIGGLLMVIPGTVTDLAGLAVLVVVLVLQRIENKKDKAAASV